MRYPLTPSQVIILVKLINNHPLSKRDMNPINMVILTQVGAIKMIDNKLSITDKGRMRFIKWHRKGQRFGNP